MKKHNFKVGDVVEIIDNVVQKNPRKYGFNDSHNFKIGTIVKITYIDEDQCIPICVKEKEDTLHQGWWVNPSDIRIANNHKLVIECDGEKTTATYSHNGKEEKVESVHRYYKDDFDFKVAVEAVTQKIFTEPSPSKVFEKKVELKLGRKPTEGELLEAYREEFCK